MSRANGKFDFKRFSVSHSKSSMKIGVDGVLIGLWTDMPGSGAILDVGCGCGIISLICAQRTESEGLSIEAIDIDEASIEEARENFLESPWSDRIHATQEDFSVFIEKCNKKYSLIISNPPFFSSGVKANSSRRFRARHQGSLSPSSLIEYAPSLLNHGGRLSMVVPTEFASTLVEEAENRNLLLEYKTMVLGNSMTPSKRTLLQFRYEGEIGLFSLESSLEYPFGSHEYVEDSLILEEERGIPTPEYRKLGKDFYLKF